MTYSTKELIYHYNCGDLKEVLFAQDLSKVVSLQNSSHSSNHNEMEQARKLDEYLREELIYKRNRRMAKRVLKLIEEEPKKKFFFAFGAGIIFFGTVLFKWREFLLEWMECEICSRQLVKHCLQSTSTKWSNVRFM